MIIFILILIGGGGMGYDASAGGGMGYDASAWAMMAMKGGGYGAWGMKGGKASYKPREPEVEYIPKAKNAKPHRGPLGIGTKILGKSDLGSEGV